MLIKDKFSLIYSKTTENVFNILPSVLITYNLPSLDKFSEAARTSNIPILINWLYINPNNPL